MEKYHFVPLVLSIALVWHATVPVQVAAVKSGSCPTSPDTSEGNCITECTSDESCAGFEKCCSNGCGYVCRMPSTISSWPWHKATNNSNNARLQTVHREEQRGLLWNLVQLFPQGYCPSLPNGPAESCAEVCQTDHDCLGLMRCCYNGCGRSCEAPAFGTKQGFCPRGEALAQNCSAYQTDCSSDVDCPLNQKCCFIGSQCRVGCVVAEHRGSCPVPKEQSVCRQYNDQCFNDAGCQTDEKCCFANCGRQCVKIFTCPAPTRSCAFITHRCMFDHDCAGGGHCCDDGCGRQCIGHESPTIVDSALVIQKESQQMVLQHKPGMCSIMTQNCVRQPNFCLTDFECPGEKKCCESGCGTLCIAAVQTSKIQLEVVSQGGSSAIGNENFAMQKKFACPIQTQSVQCFQRINECFDDSQCTGHLLCCNTSCGHSCLDPEVAVTNQQESSSPLARNSGGINTIQCQFSNFRDCSTILDLCNGNSDCQQEHICCDTGCGRECIPTHSPTPTINRSASGQNELTIFSRTNFFGDANSSKDSISNNRSKPGQCVEPERNIKCLFIANQCANDFDCSDIQKCCASECGTQCQYPNSTP